MGTTDNYYFRLKLNYFRLKVQEGTKMLKKPVNGKIRYMCGILCLISHTHMSHNQQLFNQESFTKLFKYVVELPKASKQLHVEFTQLSENICTKNVCKDLVGI